MARTIQVDTLARVEGEGSLIIRFRGEEPREVELRIFEPPRFFEGLLRGREQEEAPDITSRICGICPVAYQMTACQAIENAQIVSVDDGVRRLRRLLYAGEWIESHTLHMFMLHLPDFLGYPDAIAMAHDHQELVQQGLRIKKVGNSLVSAIGGREIHPINARTGGFYRAVPRTNLDRLLPELGWARDAAENALSFMARLEFPEFERDYEFVALHHPDEYPFCEGRIVSNKGLDIDASEFDGHFEEEHVERSTALHCRLRERGAYLCGPLARFNLDFAELRPRARAAAEAIGLAPPCKNPFKSLLVRCVEVIQVLDEAIDIIDSYVPPAPASVEIPQRAATGYGATEAPRGLLYHRYRIDGGGLIESAKIVPPTSQNQQTIEQDLFALAPQLAVMPHAEATWRAEQAVRNYDPCISCSTHFLKLSMERD